MLGTLVEITARGLPQARLNAAVEAAFAAVQRVQDLMSFHDEASDVSRVNRHAARRAVTVDEWTFAVLAEALEFSRLSGGAFDITVAPTLIAWGFLPRHIRRTPGRAASWTDITLLSSRRVRFRRPLALDLGGIAKGFAVDQAIGALQTAGVSSGVVNAGGDLRVFGSRRQEIHVRHPASPGLLLPLFQLRNEAVATSAPYFSARCWRGRTVSPLVHPPTREPFTSPVSVSVRASRCVLADALTKVVLADACDAESVLTAFGAQALVLSA